MKVKTNLQKLIKVKSDVKISKLLIQLLWKDSFKMSIINVFKTKWFKVRKTKENTSTDIIGTSLLLKNKNKPTTHLKICVVNILKH